MDVLLTSDVAEQYPDDDLGEEASTDRTGTATDDAEGEMRAAVMRGGALVVDELVGRAPQPGQVLAEVLACGICGSDLHALAHADQMVEMSTVMAADAGPLAPRIMDPGRDVVMGHELSARVLEVGENVGNCRPDDVVVSMPIVMDASGVHALGYSNDYVGGYAQHVVLSDVLCSKVPEGVDPRLAALTEPMAVGLHALGLSRLTPRDSAVVLGCGPVGLAVVAACAAMGLESVVAADFSPKRRALATAMGATEAVDPRVEPAMDAWRRVDGRREVVVFEAVGVPGMLDAAITAAPRRSQIVVVGVCMTPDTIRPMVAVGKETNLQFSFGYDPMEFAESLRRIAEEEYDVRPMITGEVGLDGVAGAFEALGEPDAHAKILVIPD
jgi:threonine dehydrogenase-like Zn-dependent dehydrogenase